MVLTGERSLLTALIPPGAGHIDACFSLTFRHPTDLLALSAVTASLAIDFLIKAAGKVDLRNDLVSLLPAFPPSPSLNARVLLLNCLTTHFADIWRESFDPSFTVERWTKQDSRLNIDRFRTVTPEWSWSRPLRTDYERRQALVEIDVLAAMELGLTLDELCTIYRIQFPVLKQNEQDTWYDRNGRIVFTCSKGLPGVGFSRPEWEKIRDIKLGTVSREIDEDTLPGGPRKRIIAYEAPFDRCDREEDYKTAWAEFEKRHAAKGAEA